MPIFNRLKSWTRAIPCGVNAGISLASDVLPPFILYKRSMRLKFPAS
jgi:hypothetical protein